MDLVLKPCTQEDLSLLCELSCRTFTETFARSNPPEELQAYLDRAYAPERLRSEYLNPASQFFMLYADGRPAGYLKINEANAQTEFQDGQSLEIERIYVLQQFQGCWLGSYLMGKAVDLAQARDKAYIWLGVWEKNEKAIAFYQRYGFYRVGTHSFFVGSDEQTDYIMRKDLTAL